MAQLRDVQFFFISESDDHGKRVDPIIATELGKHIANFQRYGFPKGVYIDIDYSTGEASCIDCDRFDTGEWYVFASVVLRTDCDILAEAEWESHHNGSTEDMAKRFARSFAAFYQKYRDVPRLQPIPICNCQCPNPNQSQPVPSE
jgi:hypothetical protein